MAPSEITVVPRDPLAPTPVVLVERQQVTTISVVASSTPSGMGGNNSAPEKKGFPVAVAIPALVGGMAAAIAAFGIWWWCHKRSKRERRVSWRNPWDPKGAIAEQMTGAMGGSAEEKAKTEGQFRWSSIDRHNTQYIGHESEKHG